MESKLNELYNELAQALDSTIPTEWFQLYFLGEVEKNRVSCDDVFYFSTEENGEYERSHDIPSDYHVSKDVYNYWNNELMKLVLKIYDCFVEYEQPPWEQMSLSLNSEGHFKIDFNYDVMNPDDGGQSRREVIWAYETFGYIPADGSYPKEIFDKYVAK